MGMEFDSPRAADRSRVRRSIYFLQNNGDVSVVVATSMMNRSKET